VAHVLGTALSLECAAISGRVFGDPPEEAST
jgi:hypothetical protein